MREKAEALAVTAAQPGWAVKLTYKDPGEDPWTVWHPVAAWVLVEHEDGRRVHAAWPDEDGALDWRYSPDVSGNLHRVDIVGPAVDES